MRYPVIGLTSTRELDRKKYPRNRVAEAYTRAVSEAGGIPVLIPLGLEEDKLTELLTRLDGILFTGGGDTHPSRYGHAMDPLVKDIDNDRDRLELALFQDVMNSQKPFFGICRGLQVINIALGGTLYEDILDQMPGAQPHAFGDIKPRNYLAHLVRVKGDSRLAHMTGFTQLEVNSLHHQGIRDLAPVAVATAWAPDGLIEAIEVPGNPYGLAVQWHPECLPESKPMRSLFREFIGTAKRHMDKR